MLTIDPSKVVEYGPPAVQQLARLTNAAMKHWKDAPQQVRIELGNAVALLNKVISSEEKDDGDSKKV
jgi:hypothetical protein